VLAFFIKQIPLDTESGLVARGEAIGGEEAERLAAGGAPAHWTRR
jgi:hypothetical protein